MRCSAPHSVHGVVMSSDDSAFWRARADEMRVLAETVEGEISKQLLHRIADDYERFARTIEGRPNRFVPSPDIVPLEVKRFGQRSRAPAAPPLEFSDRDLPSFLKRGPATAEEPSRDDEKS
jgi:hypothetical protein